VLNFCKLSWWILNHHKKIHREHNISTELWGWRIRNINMFWIIHFYTTLDLLQRCSHPMATNFVRWRPLFLFSQRGTCFLSPLGRLEFWGGFWILGQCVHPWLYVFLHRLDSSVRKRSPCITPGHVSLRYRTTENPPSSVLFYWDLINLTPTGITKQGQEVSRCHLPFPASRLCRILN
jgi:hypothetical protein